MRIVRLTLLAAVCVGGCLAQSPLTEVKRGLTGAVTFSFEGEPLEARAQPDLSAPILLRLESDDQRSSTYVARFLASVAGDYDLRELIQFRGGAEPVGLRPLPVRVVSNLDDQLSTDLYDAADLEVGFSGRYLILAWLVVMLWIAVPAVVIVRRILRKPVVEPVPEAPRPPTLADRLRPLCRAAAERTLSVAEQGRLELLLYHFWRERLGLGDDDVPDAVRVLRDHAEAGALLRAVEEWLHSPTGARVEGAKLEDLLAPYRSEPAPSDEAEVARP